jgi:hypothetical protein
MSHRRLVVGTTKGLFIFLFSNSSGWRLDAHHLSGWEVSALLLQGPRIVAGTVHYAYGPTFRETRDHGAHWSQLAGRPAHADSTGFKNNRIWQVVAPDAAAPDHLLAGIDEAGLFKSVDGGANWTAFDALNNHSTRQQWFPGAGGLCLHTILVDPTDPRRMWVGISAGGCLRTEDGGASWRLCNAGLKPLNTGAPTDAGTAFCVHKIVQHPTRPGRLFMQYHGGVYESVDGADNWVARESGLPGNFGFPMAITPAGTLLVAPLLSDEQRHFASGKASLFRSTDFAESWQPSTQGLPDEPSFVGVLRDAMCSDAAGNLYFGTSDGQVFASADQAKSWARLPATLPRVLVVRADELTTS